MKYATAKNKANTREVESMFSKAMCAYANWQNSESAVGICNDEELAQFYASRALIDQSEYEATVRCLAMFTEEHLPEVCTMVIEACKEEFGI